MKCLLRRMLDPDEFLSDYGVRSMSKFHSDTSLRSRRTTATERVVSYEPGGIANQHLRRQLELARPGLVPDQFSPDRIAPEISSLLRRRFQSRMPDRLRTILTLNEIANELSNRLIKLWLRDEKGERPFTRGSGRFVRRRTRIASCISFTNFSTATRRGLGRQSSDWLDRSGREADSATRHARHDRQGRTRERPKSGFHIPRLMKKHVASVRVAPGYWAFLCRIMAEGARR